MIFLNKRIVNKLHLLINIDNILMYYKYQSCLYYYVKAIEILNKFVIF